MFPLTPPPLPPPLPIPLSLSRPVSGEPRIAKVFARSLAEVRPVVPSFEEEDAPFSIEQRNYHVPDQRIDTLFSGTECRGRGPLSHLQEVEFVLAGRREKGIILILASSIGNRGAFSPFCEGAVEEIVRLPELERGLQEVMGRCFRGSDQKTREISTSLVFLVKRGNEVYFCQKGMMDILWCAPQEGEGYAIHHLTPCTADLVKKISLTSPHAHMLIATRGVSRGPEALALRLREYREYAHQVKERGGLPVGLARWWVEKEGKVDQPVGVQVVVFGLQQERGASPLSLRGSLDLPSPMEGSPGPVEDYGQPVEGLGEVEGEPGIEERLLSGLSTISQSTPSSSPATTPRRSRSSSPPPMDTSYLSGGSAPSSPSGSEREGEEEEFPLSRCVSVDKEDPCTVTDVEATWADPTLPPAREAAVAVASPPRSPLKGPDLAEVALSPPVGVEQREKDPLGRFSRRRKGGARPLILPSTAFSGYAESLIVGSSYTRSR